jgi:nicotinamidase-related amidase
MPSDTEELYREAGIEGRVGFGESPAVIVVDLQRGFTDPACPLGSDLDAVVEDTSHLLTAAREAGVPVVFTRGVYRPDGRDGGPFAEKVPSVKRLTRDSKWTEIDPRLKPQDDEHVVDKQQPSGFFRTELDTMFTHRGIDTTIIAGATTSGCVRATVLDACMRGYRPIVPWECVGDRAPDPHEANLFDIDSKYGDVVDLEAVVRRLRPDEL